MRFTLAITILLVVFAAGAVSALTIEPRTYNLEWQVNQSPTAAAPTSLEQARIISEAQAAQFSGLKSTKCRIADVNDLLVIIDESAGTGTGYNTAYVMTQPAKRHQS